MNVFDLFAKLTLDTSDFDKQVTDASKSFDKLGGSAADVPKDTQKAEKAVDKFTQSVEETTTETNQAETALNDAERAIRDVGKGAGKAAPPLKETSEGLGDVGGEGKGADDSLKKFGKTIVGSVAKGVTLANVVSQIVTAISEFAEAVWNMDESTEDFRVSMGKLETAFNAVGYSNTSARRTFRDFYKILGDTDTAVEASQLLAKLTSNMEEQSRWTEIAAGVYGTFGDSLPINGLIEAANETAKVGKVTGVLADALNWVGISEDDFNLRLAACADTQERAALITDTLSASYKNAANTMQENNSTIMRARESQLRLQEAQAKVGEQTSRLKTAFSNILSPSVEKLLSLMERLVGKFADVSEGWESTADAIRNPLPTDSVEDARAKLDELKSTLADVKGQLAGVTEAEDADTFWRLTYQVENLNSQITHGTAQLSEMEAAESSAAESATETADAIDKMTVSANGFSVELSGSNLTLEEATERLQTYTDAATNMFSRINTESDLSYKDALDNMRHNIDATNDFSANMAAIAGELPADLAEIFNAGGPEMYAGVVAMLAEANAGSEEGLAELRALYEEGGAAAMEAFAQSVGAGKIDADPAAQLAEGMDKDVTCEQAGQDLVDRTASAISAQVAKGSFYSSGAAAVDRFIAGMRSRRTAAITAAQGIASAVDNALGSSRGASSHAGGLDYVPYDGYPAILHRGESVLPTAEAEDWRRGTTNTAGITIVQNIQSVPQTPVELAAATAAYFEMARWAI